MRWISEDSRGAIYVTVWIFFSHPFPRTVALHGPLYIIYIFVGLCRDTVVSGRTIKNCVHCALNTAKIKFESRGIIIICTCYLFEGTQVLYSTPVELRIALLFACQTQTFRTRTYGRSSDWRNSGGLGNGNSFLSLYYRSAIVPINIFWFIENPF